MEYIFHTFIVYFNKGGIIMWVILFISIVGWYLCIERYMFLKKFMTSRKAWLSARDKAMNREPWEGVDYLNYHSLLHQIENYLDKDSASAPVKEILREFWISSSYELERRFSTISSWVSVCPLLGLLGTVTGMIETFRVITQYGLGNPNLTAEGISIALLTTQAGLTAAFPLLILHNWLVNKKDSIINQLKLDSEDLLNRIAAKKGYSVQELLEEV